MSQTPIRIVDASSREELDDARALLIEYAESLGWDLSQGGRFADEVADPPGPYGPPSGALLVAYLGGEPAGVLGLQAVPEEARVSGVSAGTMGELKRLYVRPDHRGQGVARALMLRAEDEARIRAYESAVLTTADTLFPFARGLYESLGYGIIEPYRSDLDWPDLIWMGKEL